MLIVADILEALTGSRPAGANHRIRNVVVDARLAAPDDLFVAIPGEGIDERDEVEAAFERGARLVLVERDLTISNPVLDLRPPTATGLADFSGSPSCLLVQDTLAALQQLARFWRRRLGLRVVGITGSVGKSTTKELVADVLDQRYPTLRNTGNMNNGIGVPLTLLSL
jgi:UDP-N-acetylmuramoyl-tripeptide--D-alanyl-D-alanine ligase